VLGLVFHLNTSPMTALAHPSSLLPPDTLAQNYLRKQELFGWLDRMGQELELSETRYLDAESKYQTVSAVLHGCPILQPFSPQIFAQGSFALGTTVKPLHGDEHDLDFICLLPRAHHQRQTQRQIYNWVFQRLATHGTYQTMVEPKNRCVRICYANEFHLDITPAVYNPFCSQKGLYVPDRTIAAWQASHPKGYVEWFTPIAALQPRFRTLEKAMENRHVTFSSTEPVPDQRAVRGVLRRAIQFMKRHRDLYRERHEEAADYAPISIVITTLAAHAYRRAVALAEYESEFDVLNAVVELMPLFINVDRTVAYRPLYRIDNPTTIGENFADKWKDNARYYEVFNHWHQAVQQDLRHLEQVRGRDEVQKALRNSLGTAETDRVFSQQVQQFNQARNQKQVLVNGPTRNAAAAIAVPHNNFFGG
jgi:hypothetical protein